MTYKIFGVIELIKACSLPLTHMLWKSPHIIKMKIPKRKPAGDYLQGNFKAVSSNQSKRRRGVAVAAFFVARFFSLSAPADPG